MTDTEKLRDIIGKLCSGLDDATDWVLELEFGSVACKSLKPYEWPKASQKRQRMLLLMELLDYAKMSLESDGKS